MKTIEVPRQRWRLFCERVTEFHRGAMVDIQLEEPEGEEKLVAKNEPLQLMVLDEQTDECNDLVIIETGELGQKANQHRIIEPVYIRLKNGKNERYNHVYILAESGNRLMNPQ
jgi:hypothetical protein